MLSRLLMNYGIRPVLVQRPEGKLPEPGQGSQKIRLLCLRQGAAAEFPGMGQYLVFKLCIGRRFNP